MYPFRWALVDIETTGLHLTQDEITEIAVLILTDSGVALKWHRLLKPRRSISPAITALTGISNDMVNDAPSFGDIAHELLGLLQSCVFVAHNARFDYGFIKNGFKRVGLNFQAPVLCTIKLLKQLCPGEACYNLAYTAQSFGLAQPTHHRAEADVHTLHQILEQLSSRHTWAVVLEKAKAIYQKSSIPSKLTTDISQLPDSPGVYLFYGEKNELPLYIGKSITVRQRVLSHFSGDYTHAKEFALSQQVARVEMIPTAGELSALLLESELIKTLMPIYNRKLRRKTQLAGYQLSLREDYLTVSIVRKQVEDEEDLKQGGIYGAFRSIAAAKRMLLQLIKKHDLCPKLCGVEQGRGACFSHQLKKCLGACADEELPETYNKRLMAALEEYQEITWPYKGAIAIKEYCPINKITQYILIYQWRHLGTESHEHQLEGWRDKYNSISEKSHTFDAYKIIYSYLKNKVLKEEFLELH